MNNKTMKMAATTGVFGFAIGALVAPPSLLKAQQNNYANPSATPTKQVPSVKQSCPQDAVNKSARNKSATSSAVSGTATRLQTVSFDGPPPREFGGPRDARDFDSRDFGGPPDDQRGPGRDNGRPDGRAHGSMLGDMIEQLNLNAEQKEKIAKVLDFEREKMDALDEQCAKIQSQTRTNLEALLTTEQKQQLGKMETQAQNDGPMGGPPQGERPFGGRPHDGRHGPRPDGRDGGRPDGPRGERGGPGGW